MTQRSLFWNGTTVGDADVWAPYHLGNKDEISSTHDVFFRALFDGTGNRGVLEDWLNELAVTAPGAVSPVQVNTGGGIIYGLFYENTAAVNVTIPTPTSTTRRDRIVVRRNWATQTARITRIPGVEGGGTPSLVQSPAPSGTGIYDIPLATVAITTAGAVAVTDEREFCELSTVPQDASIATAHLVNESAGWVSRATRTKRLFFGSPIVEIASAVYFKAPWTGVTTDFNYRFASVSSWSYLRASGFVPLWDGALPPGWYRPGGTINYHYYFTFKVPAEYRSGSLTPYVWWICTDTDVPAFSWRTSYQMWSPSGFVYAPGSYDTAAIASAEINHPNRTVGMAIDDVVGDEMVHYFVNCYNPTGTGVIKMLGLEVDYEGYIP